MTMLLRTIFEITQIRALTLTRNVVRRLIFNWAAL